MVSIKGIDPRKEEEKEDKNGSVTAQHYGRSEVFYCCYCLLHHMQEKKLGYLLCPL